MGFLRGFAEGRREREDEKKENKKDHGFIVRRRAGDCQYPGNDVF
jgi:hypothetical protein